MPQGETGQFSILYTKTHLYGNEPLMDNTLVSMVKVNDITHVYTKDRRHELIHMRLQINALSLFWCF